MIDKENLLRELRSLAGKRVLLHDESFQVIEILPEGPVVVLQSMAADKVIQANAQGEATRRVPLIVEVPAWLGGTDVLDPRVKGWLGDAGDGA